MYAKTPSEMPPLGGGVGGGALHGAERSPAGSALAIPRPRSEVLAHLATPIPAIERGVLGIDQPSGAREEAFLPEPGSPRRQSCPPTLAARPGPGRCHYPGCDRPVASPPIGGGRPRKYCSDPAHDRARAFRARRALAARSEPAPVEPLPPLSELFPPVAPPVVDIPAEEHGHGSNTPAQGGDPVDGHDHKGDEHLAAVAADLARAAAALAAAAARLARLTQTRTSTTGDAPRPQPGWPC